MMHAQCRFCGDNNKKNKYLFDKANLECVKMAMTIYPVVIHQSDPLPKYVCDVCQLNIRKEYESRQNIINLNNRWINNLRLYEPQHGYFSLLDSIEDIKKRVVENNQLEVKGLLKQCVARVLSYEKKDLDQEELNNSNVNESLSEVNIKSNSKTTIEEESKKEIVKKVKEEKKTPKSSNVRQYMKPLKDNSDLPMTSAESVSVASSVAVPAASDDIGTTTTSNITSTPTSKKLSNLKSIFSKKSGCTFVTYGGTTIKIKTMPKIPPSSANSKPTETLVKADQHQTERANTNMIHSTCKICQQICASAEDLAMHQSKEHLQIKLHRIFQKKKLPAIYRRGRLMKVDEEQSLLRCLSCSRVYANNEEIIEHWANCKCDFYCLVCNETYPDAPKILREHVRRQHHVKHNQLRLLHENNNEEGTKEIRPVPQSLRRTKANCKCSKCCWVFASQEARDQHLLTHSPNYIQKEKRSEVSSKTTPEKVVQCKYCSKIFEHPRALNGHMRIHKPTNHYGSLTLPTNDKKNMADKYMEFEDEPEILVKNEAILEDNNIATIKTESPQVEQLATHTNFDMNLSSTSSSSLEKQKGQIKVKSMHELMNIHPPPAKYAKLETFGNWY